MQEFLDDNFILAEAAIVEQLRRRTDITLDESLVHSPLIYDKLGRDSLAEIYTDYINIAKSINAKIILATPTWRANRERVKASSINNSINADAVRFLREVSVGYRSKVKVGGLIGCKNDCYLPKEGLSALEAKSFHSWQINQLSDAGVDYLIAVTLPCVEEALGIANAMSETQKPYIISFVIGKDGKVLDGSDLGESIRYIDNNALKAPLGYFVNCSYPSFLSPESHNLSLYKRLIGIQANSSSLEHCELDGSKELKSESVKEWGDLMLSLNRDFGIKILGGCCGTNSDHLSYLAENHA